MKIQYIMQSINSGIVSQHQLGVGYVSSFSCGLSSTSHEAVLVNSAKDDLYGPILVFATLSQKKFRTIDDFNKAIDEGYVSNLFFFLPKTARSQWSVATSDGVFMASLPTFKMVAGEPTQGYLVPLTNMPPFYSRGEVGTVVNEFSEIDISDYFKFALNYFSTAERSATSRLTKASELLKVVGEEFSMPAKYFNANVSTTFSDMVEDWTIVKGTKPNFGFESIQLLPGGKGFSATLRVGETTSKDKNIATNSVNNTHLGSGAMFGSSGYINNKDIPQRPSTTKQFVYPTTTLVRVGNEKVLSAVSSIEFRGGYNIVNVFV